MRGLEECGQRLRIYRARKVVLNDSNPVYSSLPLNYVWTRCAVTWPHYQFAEFPWPEDLKEQYKDFITPPAPVVQQYIEVGQSSDCGGLLCAGSLR